MTNYEKMIAQASKGLLVNKLVDRSRKQCEVFRNSLEACKQHLQECFGNLFETLTEKPTLATIQKALQSFRKEHVSRALLFLPCADSLRKQAFTNDARQSRGDYIASCLCQGDDYTGTGKSGYRPGYCLFGSNETGRVLLATGLNHKQSKEANAIPNFNKRVAFIKGLKAPVSVPVPSTDKKEVKSKKTATPKKEVKKEKKTATPKKA